MAENVRKDPKMKALVRDQIRKDRARADARSRADISFSQPTDEKIFRELWDLQHLSAKGKGKDPRDSRAQCDPKGPTERKAPVWDHYPEDLTVQRVLTDPRSCSRTQRTSRSYVKRRPSRRDLT